MIEGNRCQITIDTGSDISLIRPDILKAELNAPLTPVKDSHLRTVTGTTAPLQSKVDLQLQLGNLSTHHTFYLADIADECILCMDYLKPAGALLDIGRSCMTVGSKDVPLTGATTGGEAVCRRAVAAVTTTLPAQSEAIIPVQLVGQEKDWKPGWVLLHSGDAYPKNWLLVGRTLVDVSQKVLPVRVMNKTTGSQKIKKGSDLAKCELVDEVIQENAQPSGNSGRLRELPDHVKDLYERSASNLSTAQKEELQLLLLENADLFSKSTDDLGQTGMVQHKIDTGTSMPIRQPPRRLPLAQREEADNAVQDMYKQGLIEPSESPWASPIVLVRKKDGSLRFCVDYRALNSVTRKDSYPLPRIDDTLDTLAGMTLFSTLDLKSGYWQVKLEPRDKEKTAFSTGKGLWQFKVMPFGLCNAPATFERLMERVLVNLPLQTALVYLDDILVPGKTFSHHLANLRTVFQRLRAAKLKLAPQKCMLLQKEVKFLGHIIGPTGVSTDPEKTRVVETWPTPTKLTELRRGYAPTIDAL